MAPTARAPVALGDPMQAGLLRDEARQGGFGVNLMRKMASAMHYERQDGENVLTLTLAR